jgi:hypothetical protein
VAPVVRRPAHPEIRASLVLAVLGVMIAFLPALVLLAVVLVLGSLGLFCNNRHSFIRDSRRFHSRGFHSCL